MTRVEEEGSESANGLLVRWFLPVAGKELGEPAEKPSKIDLESA